MVYICAHPGVYGGRCFMCNTDLMVCFEGTWNFASGA